MRQHRSRGWSGVVTVAFIAAATGCGSAPSTGGAASARVSPAADPSAAWTIIDDATRNPSDTELNG